jgi:molecular chaperone HscB
MKLDDDDFTLFGLPPRHALDRADLDAALAAAAGRGAPRPLRRQGTAAQRVAMQWAVRVNEAYQRLKDPLKRAAYLCELRGAPIDAERNTAMPAAFLMQQMAWREALDEAAGRRCAGGHRGRMSTPRAQLHTNCRRQLDERGDAPAGRGAEGARADVRRAVSARTSSAASTPC